MSTATARPAGVPNERKSIPLTAVPGLPDLPTTISVSAVKRWWAKGVSGIRLKVHCVGRRPCTTREDLMDFFQRVADARRSGDDRHGQRGHRRRATARAA